MRRYFLQSGRLGFSLWCKEDLPLATSLWGDPRVTAHISATGTLSIRQIQERLTLEIHNQQSVGVQYWPLFLLESGVFVGCCGLRPYPCEAGVWEIGFHLRPDFWGKGLGREAAKVAMEYAFQTLNAKALFAGHHPENAASAGLLTKLGFVYIHDELYEPTGLRHPSYRYTLNA